ncbi:MAG: YcxB family protein [Pseudomonadota bacterium]
MIFLSFALSVGLIPYIICEIKDLYFDSDLVLICYCSVITFVIAFYVSYYISYSSKLFPKDDGAFLKEKNTVINSDGLRQSSANSEYFVKWDGIFKIKKTKSLLLLYLDNYSVIVLPIRAFSTTEAAEIFYQKALEYHDATKKESA